MTQHDPVLTADPHSGAVTGPDPAQGPSFIVIGAQKSASTFIQNCLNEHPDIFLPKGETPYFEDPDYGEAGQGYWSDLFTGRCEAQLGIKRPNYIGKPEVPGRIAADMPDTLLIAVLRNPIDRIVAAYFHQIKYGTLPARPLDEGLSEILDGGPVTRAYPRASELVEFGLYARHLEGYRPFLDKGTLKCLLHEDIVADPLEQVQSCYRFLGVDGAFVPQSLHERPQKVVYSIPRLRFLGLRNRFLHSYNEDRTRLSVRKMSAPETAFVYAVSGLDKFVLARLLPAEKPKLPEHLRARLAEVYREDVTQLGDMLGRDLFGWLAPKAKT